MSHEFAAANDGAVNSRCLPTGLDTTALKRINMALRWLVRRDGIVDMGVWTSIKPSQLFIPLDVHVGNTARALGLLQRRGNDRKAVEQLTALCAHSVPTTRTLRLRPLWHRRGQPLHRRRREDYLNLTCRFSLMKK